MKARQMTVDECNKRASRCADNAGLAGNEAMASEFLRLAAHWRAIAVREIFLGQVEDSVGNPTRADAAALAPGDSEFLPRDSRPC